MSRHTVLGAVTALMLALPVFPAAAARLVDYAVDDAALAKQAEEQGLAPLTPAPARSGLDLSLELDPAVDHEVVRGGIACSAWTVQNPMATLVRRALAAWDRDGTLVPPNGGKVDLAVKIDRAGTFSRCVASGELKGVCITRVSIDGSATAGAGGAATPIHVVVEKSSKSVGMCAGLTRGVGLISRDAVIAMIAELGGRAAAVPPPH